MTGVQLARYSARRLIRQPLFTLGVVVSLALGLGAGMSMIRVVDSLLFRPPPHVHDPNRLVRIETATYPDYEVLRDQARSFVSVAAYSVRTRTLGHADALVSARAHHVTSEFFAMLGSPIGHGRAFAADEHQWGAPHVIVISHELWQTLFAGNRDALGATVTIAGEPHTIVGITKPGFTGADVAPVDLYLPVENAREFGNTDALTSRSALFFRTLGRLREGVAAQQARAEVTALYRRNAAGDRSVNQDALGKKVIDVTPVIEHRLATRTGSAAVSVWVAGTAVLLLLISCGNVAALLLLRSARNARDSAVRLALGARRTDLVYERLWDITLLVILAGSAALLITRWTTTGIEIALFGGDVRLPRAIDARLLVIATLCGVLAIAVASLGPLTIGTRTDIAARLRDGDRATSRHGQRIRELLVAGQLALAVVLVIGAGLFMHSVWRVRALDAGFPVAELIFVPLNLPSAGVATGQVDEITSIITDRVRRVPAVRSVGAVVGDRFGTISYAISVPGRDSLPSILALGRAVALTLADGTYISTLSLPVLAGRLYTDADDRPGNHVALISKRVADAYWTGMNPIGACIRLGRGDSARPCYQVIGVVGDRRNVLEAGGVPEVFVPLHSGAKPEGQPIIWDTRGLLVRTQGRATVEQSQAINRVVNDVLPTLPRIDTQTLEDFYGPFERSWRLGATLLSVLASLATILVLFGVHGVVASMVAERKRDIGIRIALGSSKPRVGMWLARRLAWIIPVAVLGGLVVARAGARSAERLLFQTSPTETGVYVAAIVLVLLTVIFAAAMPVAQALRISPRDVMQTE